MIFLTVTRAKETVFCSLTLVLKNKRGHFSFPLILTLKASFGVKVKPPISEKLKEELLYPYADHRPATRHQGALFFFT